MTSRIRVTIKTLREIEISKGTPLLTDLYPLPGISDYKNTSDV